MSARSDSMKRKIIAIIIIDGILFFALMLASYSLFYMPAKAERAENVTCLDDPPCPTETPDPTRTPDPTCTFTLSPSPTDTIEPSATITPVPTDTNTPEPTDTNTPEPTDTNTPEPTDTNTPEPSATHTLTPSPSSTLTPTSTVTGTIVPSHTPTKTLIPPTRTPTTHPTRTPTPHPSRTPTQISTPPLKTRTPTATSTLKVVTPTATATATQVNTTCTTCYVVKDFNELIISGLFSADLLNSEEISSTFTVSITLYDTYEGIVVGKTLEMVDTQPTGEVMHVQTPLWCIEPVKDKVYWIHTEASAEKITGELWFIYNEWVRVDLSKSTLINP